MRPMSRLEKAKREIILLQFYSLDHINNALQNKERLEDVPVVLILVEQGRAWTEEKQGLALRKRVAVKFKITELFNPVSHEVERRLLEQRKIYLWGQINDDTARQIVERLLYLDTIGSHKDIYLYINSPGGVITSGMAVYDTMKMIKSDVATVCMGLAASMGALLLCGGASGKRFVFPHSRIMIHQPLISGQIIAPAVDIKIQAEEIRKIRDELNRIIADSTKRSLEQVEMDTDRDYYLNAKEAIEYGIVDKIIDSV